MKRQNHLFEHIVDYQNIRLAFLKAVRGKRASPAVVFFCRNIDKNLLRLRQRLLVEDLEVEWGAYRQFTITDPKQRIISAVPFEDRIIHHAVMNVLEPVFERQFIFHTYACRKGKGTHAAVKFAFSTGKANPYFLKLDMRKYFDSIDHAVLKSQLVRLIKDKKIISLLFGIIDGYCTTEGKGIPIGNLTSQFFANVYLSAMDHFILENLRPQGYARYMDDFVLWEQDKNRLKQQLDVIQSYVNDTLHLTLKQPILGKTAQGLPFLGFLIKDRGIYVLQKSKQRMWNRAKTISGETGTLISEEKAQERLLSVFAAVGLARTNAIRYNILHGCGFGF
jgi:hypothetical protein